MLETVVTLLLWFAAIGCGLIAGIYFAFSAFIMTAFKRIDVAAGVAAMNAINRVILTSLFMPLFWGTTLASLALALAAILRWGQPGAAAMLTGGLVYLAGMFLVTALFNVPLNRALERAGEADRFTVWSGYLGDWTRWNHLRTLASTAAAGLYVLALVVR